MAPRETENNAYAKFWGDKQRTLWYVMVFLEWSIATIPLEYSHSAIGHDTDPVARASSSWTIGITTSLSHGIAL